MKARCKQPIEILLVLFMLSSIIPLWAQDGFANYITISGVVKDKSNKKKLEYVNISVPGSNTGTVTNADGAFSFKVKESIHADRVEISHIGYANTQIQLNGKNISNQTVLLTPSSNLLQEVLINARNPRQIVEEAIKKIPVNYSSKNNMLTGFYRETAKKGRHYINISEAIIDIYKTTYSEEADYDRVKITKGRKLLSQKQNDTLVVKLIGGPNLSLYVDIVKNRHVVLDPEMISCYSFHMDEPTTISGRPQYVISFLPQVILPYALYYGKLYIDKERLSVTCAEFNLSVNNKSKVTQAILRKKPFGLRFKPLEISFFVNYKERDGVTYLNYIRSNVEFKCDWKRRLFSTNYSVLSEMVVTDREENNITYIPAKMSFKETQSLSDKVTDFLDENFWGAYNIIEPTESLESAVNRLKKQQQ